MNKSLLKGINYSIYTSILLTFIGTIIYCFWFHSYKDFLVVFVFMSVITSAITLFISSLFGTAIVLILEEINVEGNVITTILGSLLGYLIGLIFFKDWILMKTVFTLYGTCCGFSFSFGYNKGIK